MRSGPGRWIPDQRGFLCALGSLIRTLARKVPQDLGGSPSAPAAPWPGGHGRHPVG